MALTDANNVDGRAIEADESLSVDNEVQEIEESSDNSSCTSLSMWMRLYGRTADRSRPYLLNLVAALDSAGIAIAGVGGGEGASSREGNKEEDDGEDGGGSTTEHCE